MVDDQWLNKQRFKILSITNDFEGLEQGQLLVVCHGSEVGVPGRIT